MLVSEPAKRRYNPREGGAVAVKLLHFMLSAIRDMQTHTL